MDDDWKLIAIIFLLWLVQAFLNMGPLKSQIEEQLILSLIPELDILVEIGNLPKLDEVGPLLYSIKILVVVLKDSLIGYLWLKIRGK